MSSLFNIVSAGLLVAAVHPGAQSPAVAPLDPNARIAFEVASIKQNPNRTAGTFVTRRPGGRLLAQNSSLRELIRYAYQVQADQVRGGPGWLDTERWDILAVLTEVPPARPIGSLDETTLAVRYLLADRFKLTVRRETQTRPIYALVMARPGGRLGPQINQSATDCAALIAAVSRGASPPPRPTGGRPLCDVRGTAGSIQSGGFPLTGLAAALAERVQRVVIDRTGLTGTWDFSLTYSPETSRNAPGGLPAPPDSNNASLFTAIQEQLGLKLESTRGPVEVLIVENAERPTED